MPSGRAAAARLPSARFTRRAAEFRSPVPPERNPASKHCVGQVGCGNTPCSLAPFGRSSRVLARQGAEEKMLGLDPAVLWGEDDATFNHVFEFADVAGPVVGSKRACRVLSVTPRAFVVGVQKRRIMASASGGCRWRALAAAAEWSPGNIDAVIQIAAKVAGLDGFCQFYVVAATRRTSIFRLIVADAFDLALLQHAATWPGPTGAVRRSRRETGCRLSARSKRPARERGRR